MFEHWVTIDDKPVNIGGRTWSKPRGWFSSPRDKDVNIFRRGRYFRTDNIDKDEFAGLLGIDKGDIEVGEEGATVKTVVAVRASSKSEGGRNPADYGRRTVKNNFTRQVKNNDLHPPSLVAGKSMYRDKAIKNVPKGGVILELYGGTGDLTEQVYSKHFAKSIMIDKNCESLEVAKKRLVGKIQVETVCSDTMKWLEQVSEQDLNNMNISSVDFDSYGASVKPMKAFFSKYRVRKPLVMSVTDAGVLNVLLARKGILRDARAIKAYGAFINKRDDIIAVYDALLKKLGDEQGFTVKPLNVGNNGQMTVYLSYLLKPRSR